jgi:hypothetical protein
MLTHSEAKEGDKVTIIHSKPFSRRKHYQLHSIQRRIADQDGKMTILEKIDVEPIHNVEGAGRKGVLETLRENAQASA